MLATVHDQTGLSPTRLALLHLAPSAMLRPFQPLEGELAITGRTGIGPIIPRRAVVLGLALATGGSASAAGKDTKKQGPLTDSGLVTSPSRYPFAETIRRFKSAVEDRSDQGWMIFCEIDHAAAARRNGLEMQPATVIVFGNPRGGTPNMRRAPTLAIDVPPKALVWQDGEGHVWLTVNSGEYLLNYVYPRHGLPTNPASAKSFDQFLRSVVAQATA